MTNDTHQAGVLTMGGKDYMTDAKGALVPVELVKAKDKLQDETVRQLIDNAEALNRTLGAFRAATFEQIGAFEALLAQEYDTRKGGKKGNMTLMSFDGCLKVQVQVADFIDFGPELQQAKTLIDECLNEWSADSRPEIRGLVTRAFNTDKEGQINRSEIFMLLRMEIEDERWQRAMTAIRDAMRVVGSKTYVRFYRRGSADAAWEPITLDLASAA